MRWKHALVSLLAVAGSAAPALAAEPYEIGAKVADIAAKDMQGRDFRLYGLSATKQTAWAEVLAVAKEYLAPADAKPTTTLASLPGVKGDDGVVDAGKVAELVGTAGARFALVSDEKVAAGMKTLGDVAAWIEKGARAPIVIHVWSPRCPMCKAYDERIVDAMVTTGARFVTVAANYPDTDQHYKDYLEGLGFHWLVIPDREQKINDLFGGTNTPHVFVLDADYVLRYRGAVDDDPKATKEESERTNYLLDAIEAVKAGKKVEVPSTEPVG
jgi:hypothetical protein